MFRLLWLVPPIPPYLLCVIYFVLIGQPIHGVEPEPASAEQAAKDRTVVQALNRMANVDLSAFPKAKQSLLRYLRSNPEADDALDLMRRFQLKELAPELVEHAVLHPEATQGVNAARLLLDWEAVEIISEVVSSEDHVRAARLLTAVGLTGNKRALEFALPLLEQSDVDPSLLRAAISAAGRHEVGQRRLLRKVESNAFPAEMQTVLANALLGSKFPTIREQAAKFLTLPATAGGEPLPAVSELVHLHGDRIRGRELFFGKATCGKCHQVGAEGKQVGPHLTEIGSKLSREALIVSILEPSAAVSFGYEMHVLLTAEGEQLSGIVVSQTDTGVTLRDAEGIDRTIVQDDIDELHKLPKSIMPDGLERNLTVDEFVNLVEFLMAQKKS
ncbi:MAG: c-type cytochrome [Planctomycetales bacterium]|nr:c-type cytochrome [Planctomycetales bacterium]